MSYLLDALRKAERERKLGSVPDLATEADTGQPPREGLPMWQFALLGALLAVNVVAVGYFAWRWSTPAAPPASESRSPEVSTSAPPPEADFGTTNERADTQANEPAPAEPEPAPVEARQEPPQAAAAAPSVSGEPAAGPDAPDSETDASVPEDNESAAPAVTRTGEPEPAATPALDIDLDESVPSIEALPAEARRNLPTLTLNGHLYSSVPGRSFVLVNGRRYHEGERIAAGGAVESIDARGVVINHEGQRFRLAAPN